ncbi:septum formation initiator family protein [Streptomyces pactum]|uniref:Septum formation initiator family protein n=1 Tax=Streptomyces pactum TaxID=68249 RepID=A0ABS0NN52_9ACTN|nr:septum formation initiator family protein [Streptomyces pactum]MBH5336608.1 septum formation initiator family protein [Streptomyces pactum]
MGTDRDRFSTATRLKALGEHAAARVYRARGRRNRLTGRAALLALVVCSMVVALAYPIRQYVSQRSDIAEQRRRAEQAAEEGEKLREEKARLQDPAYIERLAREHLHYVRPGETGFSMLGGARDTGRADDRGAGARPWYHKLLEGLDTADRGPSPAPGP